VTTSFSDHFSMWRDH